MPLLLGHGTTKHENRLVGSDPIFVLNRHATPLVA